MLKKKSVYLIKANDISQAIMEKITNRLTTAQIILIIFLFFLNDKAILSFQNFYKCIRWNIDTTLAHGHHFFLTLLLLIEQLVFTRNIAAI